MKPFQIEGFLWLKVILPKVSLESFQATVYLTDGMNCGLWNSIVVLPCFSLNCQNGELLLASCFVTW